MAQTAGAVCPQTARIAYSITGTSSFTDFSGEASLITPGGGERASGEAYTLDGTSGIPCWGKLAPVDVTVRTVYSMASADQLGTIWDYYRGSTPVYLMYSPGGTGTISFLSSVGRFTNVALPTADAGANEPIAAEISFRAGGWTKVTNGTSTS
jgi:hypothetical protein